jgi:hypothetical protein
MADKVRLVFFTATDYLRPPLGAYDSVLAKEAVLAGCFVD